MGSVWLSRYLGRRVIGGAILAAGRIALVHFGVSIA